MTSSAVLDRRSGINSPSHVVSRSDVDSLRKFLRRYASLCGHDLNALMRLLVGESFLDLPSPGSGKTAARFAALSEIAALDLSLARLCEGHADAISILRAAGREPAPGATYGVWAAEPPSARVVATLDDSHWVLKGRKRFASGATLLNRSLITATTNHGNALFEVELSTPGVSPILGSWPAIGMAGSESLDVDLSDVRVRKSAMVGAPGFYLERSGFWHGAVGVAACWYGGALGALRMLQSRFEKTPPDDHQAAHFGFIVGACEAMSSILRDAADSIDADPKDRNGGARKRALVVRQVVEDGCQNVLQRAGRAGGTSPLVFDAEHARRAADLPVYLRQHHAERDLAELGRLALEGNSSIAIETIA